MAFLPKSTSGAGRERSACCAAVGVSEDAPRQLVTSLVQGNVEADLACFGVAAPAGYSPARRGWGNGHRRRLTTRVGTLKLRIPRYRAGRFQPSRYARYGRTEQAVVVVLFEMYVQGISTRKVTRVVETLRGATT
jgi:putative transposase